MVVIVVLSILPENLVCSSSVSLVACLVLSKVYQNMETSKLTSTRDPYPFPRIQDDNDFMGQQYPEVNNHLWYI